MVDTDSLCLRFPNVHFSSSVCDLGFIPDPALSLSDHVNSVTRSCFDYLCQLHLIRQSLPLHAITILVHALICARVDYGFPFVSVDALTNRKINPRSAPLWATVLLVLLHNTLRPTLSQFLLYLVVPPFGLRLGVTWLSLGHEHLWLNLEAFLLWAHPTGTSYLSHIGAFFQYLLISSESTWKPP